MGIPCYLQGMRCLLELARSFAQQSSKKDKSIVPRDRSRNVGRKPGCRIEVQPRSITSTKGDSPRMGQNAMFKTPQKRGNVGRKLQEHLAFRKRNWDPPLYHLKGDSFGFSSRVHAVPLVSRVSFGVPRFPFERGQGPERCVCFSPPDRKGLLDLK